tara:strand:- start:247 stop:498 length:252 start_codon:yes stop_codon:yes gene_type:complete
MTQSYYPMVVRLYTPKALKGSLCIIKNKTRKQKNYIFNRKTGDIIVNNQKGSESDKQAMIQLGTYFLSNASDSELVTVCVNKS